MFRRGYFLPRFSWCASDGCTLGGPARRGELGRLNAQGQIKLTRNAIGGRHCWPTFSHIPDGDCIFRHPFVSSLVSCFCVCSLYGLDWLTSVYSILPVSLAFNRHGILSLFSSWCLAYSSSKNKGWSCCLSYVVGVQLEYDNGDPANKYCDIRHAWTKLFRYGCLLFQFI